MSKIEIGTNVKVHYEGSLSDGSIFDSTFNSEAIIFTIGDEMMIPAFEDAVRNMEEGETVSIDIPAAEAYGEYDTEQIVKFDKKKILEYNKEIKVGDQIQMPVEDGVLVLKVIEMKGEIVTLDANSDLVGEDLSFKIELVEIVN